MKYRVIECTEPSALETEVNAAIADGWTPVGGVCLAIQQNVSYYEGDTDCVKTVYTYTQAMVKEN